MQWENSKRLIYGSLLCLSCDNFETFLYATVSDRDPKHLQKGLVQVKFTEESRLMMAGFQVGAAQFMQHNTAKLCGLIKIVSEHAICSMYSAN